MKEIPLSQGKIAIVDDDDFDRVAKFKWSFSSGYAVRSVTIGVRERATQKMARFIMGEPAGMYIDHRSLDKLDNRRSNLRVCTKQQNGCNRGIRPDNSSGHKGVGWHKNRGKWRARIKLHGRDILLGHFHDIKYAIAAYAKAAPKIHGEFARL